MVKSFKTLGYKVGFHTQKRLKFPTALSEFENMIVKSVDVYVIRCD